MRENGNGEIVKRAGIILKDNSSGEIRMDLKPEKLGKVRVQIHLKDNTLSGRIIVESSAVREVFESNMDALHRAFKESGFDSAELDVQVGGGRQQEHQGSQKQRPRTAENIRSLEEHVSLTREAGYDGVIDLVV
jgi:flagellar hook-length control protein FliK